MFYYFWTIYDQNEQVELWLCRCPSQHQSRVLLLREASCGHSQAHREDLARGQPQLHQFQQVLTDFVQTSSSSIIVNSVV